MGKRTAAQLTHATLSGAILANDSMRRRALRGEFVPLAFFLGGIFLAPGWCGTSNFPQVEMINYERPCSFLHVECIYFALHPPTYVKQGYCASILQPLDGGTLVMFKHPALHKVE